MTKYKPAKLQALSGLFTITEHVMEREAALIAIGDDLQTAKAKLERMGYSATIRKTQKGDESTATRPWGIGSRPPRKSFVEGNYTHENEAA